MLTGYAFLKEHSKPLRTTNVVESPFAAMRLRTAATKRFENVENATAVIWKTRLVAAGVVYVDGVRKKRGNEKAAA